ncbi:MAG: hypothetical protein NTV34_07630 [Proteobacteria bacterium]|nr:hypothetical protein [Pseudomonadota bacterium]
MMQTWNSRLILKIFRFLSDMVVLILVGCTANAPTDGVCERKCGNRKIGGGNLVGVPLSGDFSKECSTVDQAANNSIGNYEFQFLVYEDLTQKGASSATASSSAPTVSDTLEKSSPKRIPKGGIAFYPLVSGATASGGTSTPESEWCTDSCGFASVKAAPICSPGDFMVGIVVPGITGEANNVTGNPVPPVKLTITVKKPD